MCNVFGSVHLGLLGYTCSYNLHRSSAISKECSSQCRLSKFLFSYPFPIFCGNFYAECTLPIDCAI